MTKRTSGDAISVGAVRRALAEVNGVEAAVLACRELPYDGIRGEPPDWVQAPQRDEFHRAVKALLSVGPPGARQIDVAHSWFVEWQRQTSVATSVDGAFQRRAMLPFECARELAFLVSLYDAVQLGPIDGLERLSGRVAAAARIAGRKGGAAARVKRAEDGKETAARVRVEWSRLADRPGHERAGVIATKLGLHPQTVRKIIRKANLKQG